MKQIQSPAPVRSGLFSTLLIAAAFALVFAGQAAAESHPEPDTRILATSLRGVHARDGVAAGPRTDGAPVRTAPDGGALVRTAHGRGTRPHRGAARPDAGGDAGDRRQPPDQPAGGCRRAAFPSSGRRGNPERSAEEVQALGEALGRAQADQALQRRSERERIAGILTEEQRETARPNPRAPGAARAEQPPPRLAPLRFGRGAAAPPPGARPGPLPLLPRLRARSARPR